MMCHPGAMGGGWGKQGSGVPLAQRPRGGDDVVRLDDDDPPALPAAEQCPARHCWVAEADRHGVKRPGLLVEWRAGPGGWEGRVVYAASLRPGAWCLVEEWLPASRLTPL